tara:strand:+ start:205 stop:693 length:489 start_codon:yes stop_codon:yes gene_type:complete
MLNKDIIQGLFFGLNSGVITTVGLISGLMQTKITRIILIVSVISLAISDSASESYGLYLSKKAEHIDDISSGPLYSMISLAITKFVIVVSFLIPLLFTKSLSVFKNMSWVIGWGLFLFVILDYQLSQMRNESFFNYFIPHIFVIGLVVILTKYFGRMIEKYR